MSYRIRKALLGWLVVASACIFITGCSADRQARSTVNLMVNAELPQSAKDSLAPAAKPDVVSGASIYQAKCQACHGETGMGDGPRSELVREQGGIVAKLTDTTRLNAMRPSAWFDIVTNGRIDRLMPGFSQSLSAQERWNVLSYVWTMGTTASKLKDGGQVYLQQCAECHGRDGEGGLYASKMISSLLDLNALAGRSLIDQITIFTAGEEHKNLTLSSDDKLNVAQYIRTFSYQYADPDALRTTTAGTVGELHIQAENLTTGEVSVKGLPVVLRAYDDTGEVFSRTSNLITNVLVFGELPVQAGYFYQVETQYNGAKFFASPAQFTKTQVLSITLPVYEVTSSADAISVSEYHFFVQTANEDTISVVELYVFDNSSERAYIDQPGDNGEPRTLRVNVPAEAQNIRFDGPGIGARFSRIGDYIYDMDAVPPGKRSSTIVMIYEMPYQDHKTITRHMMYKVDAWDVLLPDGKMTVQNLTDRGVQAVQSGNIRIYSSDTQTVTAGQQMQFELSGRAVTKQIPGDDTQAIGIGLITLAASAGIGYLLVSRLRRQSIIATNAETSSQSLIDEIAGLDAQHERGIIDTQHYTDKRGELKARLRRMWD